VKLLQYNSFANLSNYLWYRRIAAFLLIVFFSFFLISNEAIAATVSAPIKGQSIDLSQEFDVYIDPTGKRTIDEISSPAFRSNFFPITSHLHKLGHVHEPIWLRFTMTQAAGDRSTKIVELLNLYVDLLEFYRPTVTGGYERSIAGERTALASRELPDRLMLFPIHQTTATETYFLRYQDNTVASLTFKLWDAEGLRRERLIDQLLLGIFYGALFVLVIYSLTLYAASRFSVYLAYTGYIFSLIVFMSAQNGFLQYFFLTGSGIIKEYCDLGTISLLCFGGLGFINQFLDTKTATPRLHRNIQILQVVCLMLIPAIVLLPWDLAHLTALSVGAAGSLTIFGIIIYFAIVKRTRAGYYSISAFALPFIGSLLMIARSFDWIEFSVFSEFGMQFGSLVEMLILAVGLSEHVAQLRQDRDTAKAATKAKSEFLSNMSHELRTPLNAILGFTQLMIAESKLTTEQTEWMQIVDSSGEHLLALINDVLEMSKIESGQIELNLNDYYLYELLDDLKGMLSQRAESKGLQLTVKISPQTPQNIYSDDMKLRQVLVNILGNAIKFTNSGSVALVVDCETIADSLRLKFRISDTGFGIAPNEIDRIFDAFKQSESGRKSQEGTGLGLSISRKFVQMMGGAIQAESQLGEGTTITFDILARVSKNLPAAIPVTTTINHLATKKLVILLAEDNFLNQKVALLLLNRLGHQVDIAINGFEVLKAIAQKSYDIVLMDMQMPEMDGLKTTYQIRLQEREQNLVPLTIIAMTANAMKEDRDRCLAGGMNDYLSKPVRLKELEACLDHWSAAKAWLS
jgi:signal transduction histidine kinase/CheY-like chemotaxis protein